MHEFVKVRFDRVFDVKRHGASRYTPAVTHFSFESSGKAYYGISAPGFPTVDPGMTVTAMLRKQGNWQTLAGWNNHSNGEVVVPSVSRAESKLIQATLITLISIFGCIAAQTSTGKVAAVLFTGTLLTLTAWNFVTWRRFAAEARAIRNTQSEIQTPKI
jgi:hypothetical protein